MHKLQLINNYETEQDIIKKMLSYICNKMIDDFGNILYNYYFISLKLHNDILYHFMDDCPQDLKNYVLIDDEIAKSIKSKISQLTVDKLNIQICHPKKDNIIYFQNYILHIISTKPAIK